MTMRSPYEGQGGGVLFVAGNPSVQTSNFFTRTFAGTTKTAALLLCLLAAPAGAASLDGRYHIQGLGNRDCRVFLAEFERSSPGFARFLAWTAGYITAMNRAAPETFDVLGERDLYAVVDWLGGYCEKNPDQPYATAVDALVKELFPDRRKTGN